MKQLIYTMDLFETKIIRLSNDQENGVSVRRVPGGWTFTEFENNRDHNGNEALAISSVFVPYNEEFKK